MDRNTLLAFFLIAVVLIFTPKYMELVSPPRPPSTKNTQADTTKSTIKTKRDTLEIVKKEPSSLFNGKVFDEKVITIENDLFSATLSSRYGGTFTSFLLKNYFSSDSQNINLIDSNFRENLTLYLNSDIENQVDLSTPWSLSETLYDQHVTEPTTLIYSKEVANNVFLNKSLTFYPDTYKINCSVEVINKSNFSFDKDITIGWEGGLNPSETNVVDDHVYFQSYVYLGGEMEKLKVKENKPETVAFNGSPDWTAIRTKYFAAILLPEDPSLIKRTTMVGEKTINRETYNSKFFYIDPRSKINLSLYLGPLEFNRIKNFHEDLENIMDFGWSFVRPISKIVLLTLTKMHQYIPNYGFILIIFSIIVKILVYPLTKKSYQSTAAMQGLQPELVAIREKYKSNPQKLNQAQMQLYKKKGVNPLGGCLPMLIQMPLLFSLFIVFRTTIELRAEPFVWWIKDLSTPDAVINLPFNIPIYGSHIAILPIFMVISMFIQQKMMTGGAQQQPQQKTMQYFMTGFFYLIFNSFPSGLNLYYTLFNVLTILQQKLIPNDSSTKTQK